MSAKELERVAMCFLALGLVLLAVIGCAATVLAIEKIVEAIL